MVAPLVWLTANSDNLLRNLIMTILALTAATTPFCDAEFLNGVGVPVLASAGTSMAANTGFTFPWVQGTLLYFVGATSNTVTLTMVNPNNSTAASNAPVNPVTASLTATVAYYFGPISSTFANGSTGLVTVNVTGTVTGCRVGVYLMSGAFGTGTTGASHNPFQMNVSGVADY
jgi:hypothetical protein